MTTTTTRSRALDWLHVRARLREAVYAEEAAFHLASSDPGRFGEFWTAARCELDSARQGEEEACARYAQAVGTVAPPPLAHTVSVAAGDGVDPLAAPLQLAERWMVGSPDEEGAHCAEEAAHLAGISLSALEAIIATGYVSPADTDHGAIFSDADVTALGALVRTMRQTGSGLRQAAWLLRLAMDGRLGNPAPDAVGPAVFPMVAVPADAERWEAFWTTRGARDILLADLGVAD